MSIIQFSYMINWVQHGTMIIDMDAWFEIAFTRGNGFNKVKNQKIIALISQDDDAVYKAVQYASAHKKSNPKLAEQILAALDPFYQKPADN